MGGQAVNHLDDDQPQVQGDARSERPALADVTVPMWPMLAVPVLVKVTHGRHRL